MRYEDSNPPEQPSERPPADRELDAPRSDPSGEFGSGDATHVSDELEISSQNRYVGDGEDEHVFAAELSAQMPPHPGIDPVPTRRRRIRLPVILFVLTLMSTFFVGVTHWSPTLVLSEGMMLFRRMMITNWDQALIYMVCVIAILLTHEMGHFIATVIYRVPASLPIFLPFPLNPIGTFGAVIGMQGGMADRRQIFDIGIAGPLAGLVVAFPIMIVGVMKLDLTIFEGGQIACQCPWIVTIMMEIIQPKGYISQDAVWISQWNPYFAAGWVGMLITGFNMMPISQMDGGHVTYTLFGKKAHWIARLTMVGIIAFMVYSGSLTLVLMIILLLIVGTDHPPTRDDTVPLGWFRVALGIVSLSIPILCFPPMIFKFI